MSSTRSSCLASMPLQLLMASHLLFLILSGASSCISRQDFSHHPSHQCLNVLFYSMPSCSSLSIQVKQVTRGLQRHFSSSLTSLSLSSYPYSVDLMPRPNDTGSCSCNTLPSEGREAAREPNDHEKTTKTLLQWVQRCTSK